jgi:hypothetical protein
MINKLKTFAMTTIVAGATAAATTALAVDTNTFTNVIQTVQISLTAYSNAVPASPTKTEPEKAITITTKSIIAALSNDAANIPALSNFDWGKSPTLVFNTTFASSNVSTLLTNVVSSNGPVALGTTNGNEIVFTATNASGTNTITFTNTPASVTISNTVTTNGGTNFITAISDATDTTNYIFTNVFTYVIGTNTNSSTNFVTNAGVWTVISAATNTNGVTNLTIITYTNVTSNSLAYVTNSSGIEVEGGTSAAPTFANVSDFIAGTSMQKSVLVAAGTGLGTTNEVDSSETYDSYDNYTIGIFGTSGSVAGNTIALSMTGFTKAMKKYDILHQAKGLTNEVVDKTFTATVSGAGSIGGTYTTNTNVVSGISIAVPTTNEISGTNAVTNGTITNIIPVVVEGTITVGAPKSVPQ